jgi:hypothetical protein
LETDNPHILISYQDNIPSDIPQGILDVIEYPKLKLSIHPLESPRLFATIEWLIPTAVFIFITKSYFDSFLKEMGKDHYALLKKGILSVWNKMFHKDEIKKFIIISSEGKIKSSQYSFAFSILSEINDQFRVKFLFDEQITEEQFEKYITLILQFLNALHMKDGNVNDYLIVEDDINHVGRIILIAFDMGKNRLRMISPIPNIKEK